MSINIAMSRFITLSITLLCLVLASCKDEVQNVVDRETDPEKAPTMSTRDVQTLISDDGKTRYRINAKVWLMYEEAKRPHWIFPDGVVAEELDENYSTKSSIICDSAYYDEIAKVWSLVGNVRVNNAQGDKILTDNMIWDQNKHKLFSEAFIHIEKTGRVIEGYGYESDEGLVNYTLRNVEAIFPFDDSRFSH